MKIQEFILVLKRQKQLLDSMTGTILLESAQPTHKQYNERIFDRGQKSTGSKLGSYNSRETTFYRWNFIPSKASAFKPTNFVTKKGKTIAQMTLAKGYKELKGIQGLRNSFVNLEYTGFLRKDMSRQLAAMNKTAGSFRVGITINDSTRVSPGWMWSKPSRPMPKTNAQKVRLLTEKYGVFLNHTSREQMYFARRFDRIFRRSIFSSTPLQGAPNIQL
jgi:hypothetical protein